MQVAQNVGSTLRPTPEMVEIIENVKKFREALETIRDFGEKMKKYADSFGTIDGRSAFKLYDTYGLPHRTDDGDGAREGYRGGREGL